MPSTHTQPALARPALRERALLAALCLALGATLAACGASPADEAAEAPARAADDATAEALRDVARATNEALSAAEEAPAPVNALARSREDGSGAGASGNGDASSAPYVVEGAESEPAAVAAAEAGRIGEPALVWFHATWCHVCQEIAPDMAALREDHADDVAFVKVDVDDPAAEEAVRRFDVRGTPTFVLFDGDGRTAARVPGWPGVDTMTAYVAQLR